MTGNDKRMHFDVNTAKEMVDAFSVSTGISCRLYLSEGELLYAHSFPRGGCSACKKLSAASGIFHSCESTHTEAISLGDKFGGRYIYYCPAYMMFSVSPIISSGTVKGALVAGPVLNSDSREYLENDPRTAHITDFDVLEDIQNDLSATPLVKPKDMNEISKQLFSNAVFISDDSRAFFVVQNKNLQQNSIGEFVQQLKNDGQSHPYPVNTEQELTNAIYHGDKPEAARLLNELLGYIFFFSGKNPTTVQTRVTELLVVLSRAAISGGANVENVLHTTEQYMQELRRLEKPDDIAQWLAEILNQLTGLVFDVAGLKHRNAIYKAVDYIRQNYAKHITLEEVADYVGYSHSYFSSIFKKEMNCSFRTYLNRVRVEKSKPLLLSGKFSIPEICEMTGFPDQSTYGKVFRNETGVSPGKYCKQNRRIDANKEHGIL